MSAGGDNGRRRRERRRVGAARPQRQPASARPPWGLSQRQLQVVDALRSAGVLSVSEIAEGIGVSRNLATLLVEDLVQLGLADRRIDPEDRRRRQVRLTAAALPQHARSGSTR